MLFPTMPSSFSPAWLVAVLAVQRCRGDALPQETNVVARGHLDLQPWPLPATTPAPRSPAGVAPQRPRPRPLNTICGYIGGDPDLPATCSAGSHCAVDVAHGAIGCCPDGAACTKGVFTSCVDHKSPPQSVADPYIYTCSSKDVCYKNSYDGGYFQYGCGSAASLATNVASTASGKKALTLTSVSVSFTATPTRLATPTTISSTPRPKTTDNSDNNKSHTTEPAAPDSSGSRSSHTGAIVGGTVGGIAGLFLLTFLAFWLWRKKGNSRQGPGQNKNNTFISPMSENRRDFEPLTSSQDHEDGPPRQPSPFDGSVDMAVPSPPEQVATPIPNNNAAGVESFHPNYPYGYGPGSTAGGIAAVRGDGPAMYSDTMPLTRELNEFSQGFNTALDAVNEDDGGSYHKSDSMSSYPSRRRDGGAPFFQQNRRTRNISWM